MDIKISPFAKAIASAFITQVVADPNPDGSKDGSYWFPYMAKGMATEVVFTKAGKADIRLSITSVPPINDETKVPSYLITKTIAGIKPEGHDQIGVEQWQAGGAFLSEARSLMLEGYLLSPEQPDGYLRRAVEMTLPIK